MFRQTLNDTKFVQLPYSKQIASTLINYGPGEVRLHKDLPATYSNSIPVRMNSQFFMPKDTVYFCSSTNPPSEIVVAEGYQQFNPIQLTPMFTGLIPSSVPPTQQQANVTGVVQNIPPGITEYYINNFLSPSPTIYPFNRFVISSGAITLPSQLNNLLVFNGTINLYYTIQPDTILPLSYSTTLGGYIVPETSVTLPLLEVTNVEPIMFIENLSGNELTGVQFGIYSNMIDIKESSLGRLINYSPTSSLSIPANYQFGIGSQRVKRALFDLMIEGSPGLEYLVLGDVQESCPIGITDNGILNGIGRQITSGTIPSTGIALLYGLSCGLEPLAVIVSNTTTATLTLNAIMAFDLGV